MNVDLKGKTALVTASSKGIGLGAARSFHRAGAKVFLCARGEAALRAAASSLPGAGWLAGDLADPAFPARLVRAAEEHFGSPVSILVANNGGPPAVEALAPTEEQWRAALEANLLSAVRLCAAAAPGMKRLGWGRIIHLTSTTAKEPDDGMVLSNVTRAAVAAYAKTLSRELAPHGVTVNTVLTGGCLTDRLRSLLEAGAKAAGKSVDDVVREVEGAIPVRRIPGPDEFAHTLLFLASEESWYLNGAAIPLDGGVMRGI